MHGRGRGWLQVCTNGVTGWVSEAHVSPDDSPWLSIAEAEVGVEEQPGSNHEDRILEYHGTCTLKAKTDEVPWCSAFANWALLQAGIIGTRLANVRSFLNWGQELSEPVRGCIVVLSRGRSPASGHVGFFVSREGGRVLLLGGNQRNRVSKAWYPGSAVLGYRWPLGV